MSDLRTAAHGVLAIGFEGSDGAAARAFAPGAIVLFGRNVGSADDLRALVADLRAGEGTPPLIAVDQEGGRVARIVDGVVALPSAMAFGAAGDPAQTETCATLLGRDLAALGISVDFAPVADLADTPASTVVGTRSYGDDPMRVGAHAAAFARGLQRGGVAATLKHFPGHGATAVDSHAALPAIDADLAALRARELVPFAQALAAAEPALVMSGHIVVRGVDGAHAATRSPTLLTTLLREELQFAGVICTDCLEMDAIAGDVGVAAGAVDALAAGADLILVTQGGIDVNLVAQAIVDAVHDGRLPQARLEDAYARVLALRARYATLAPCDGVLDAQAPAATALAAVTSLRGDAALRADAAVTVISFEGAVTDRAARSGGGSFGAPSLSAALRKRRRKSEIMRVPLDPDEDDLDLLLEHVPRLGAREFVIMTRRADLHPAQRVAVERLLALVPHALIVAAREPFDAALFPGAQRVLCCYGDSELQIDALADVLDGRASARGTLPVRLTEHAAVR